MNHREIFTFIKEDLSEIITHLEYETINENINHFKHYVQMMESIAGLSKAEELKSKPVESASTETAVPKKTAIERDNVYVFERKLKGGYVQTLEAYVPEKTVRQLHLNDGDLIRAVPIKKNANKIYYDFDLFQKKNTEDNNRIEIKYCVVEKDGEVWFTNQTLSGETIKLDEMPFTVRIRDSEVKHFHLSVGDIIDIAYYDNNPISSKVTWKHQIDDRDHSTPLPRSAYKEKNPSEEETHEEPSLIGKSVTLIGCINRQAAYRDRLTALGATFQAMDGTEEEQRISSLIQRSDFVVIIIPQVSHKGSTAAKKFCKAYNVPFVTVDSIGTTSVINSAVELAHVHEMKVGY